jgi:hypothetical protein
MINKKTYNNIPYIIIGIIGYVNILKMLAHLFYMARQWCVGYAKADLYQSI